jgi:predicted RNA-binding protein with PIN domain
VQASKDVEVAEQRAEEAERALAKARAALESADARARREADRARRVEGELRELRQKLERGARDARGDAVRGPVLRGDDVQTLVDAAELARRLADGLQGVAEQAGTLLPGAADRRRASERGVPAATAARSPAGGKPRAQPPLPPGMVEDDTVALEAMLRGSDVVLVVDGYNVSMLAWGQTPVAEQRDRLVGALAELQARTRCEVMVVFDGADVEGVRPPRRPRMRVVFSAPGEEADAVIVREVAALPPRVPVVVASSDGWVRNHTQREGARVVASQTLLRLLR